MKLSLKESSGLLGIKEFLVLNVVEALFVCLFKTKIDTRIISKCWKIWEYYDDNTRLEIDISVLVLV